HHPHGTHLPHLFPPRPPHPLLSPSNPHLPSHVGHHPPSHLSVPGWNPPPLPLQLPSRHATPPRPRRRCGIFRCLQSLHPPLPRHTRVPHKPPLRRADRRLSLRVEAAAPTRRVELRLHLPKVVVVRDNSFVWVLVNPTTVTSMGTLIQTTSFIYVFSSSLSLVVSTR
ncbi:hypothetical protein V8G54_018740, partial [Vigna mungo]